MKSILLSFVFVLFVSISYADVTLTITVPTAQVSRVKTALLYLNPKPAGYTDAEWMKKILKDFVLQNIGEYERQIGIQTAIDGVNVPDNIIQ
jgi:hypothetical protein